MLACMRRWFPFAPVECVGWLFKITAAADLGNWNVDAHGLPDDAAFLVDPARARLAVGAQLPHRNLLYSAKVCIKNEKSMRMHGWPSRLSQRHSQRYFRNIFHQIWTHLGSVKHRSWQVLATRPAALARRRLFVD